MESAISYALFCLEISEGEAFPLVLPCWVTEEESWGSSKRAVNAVIGFVVPVQNVQNGWEYVYLTGRRVHLLRVTGVQGDKCHREKILTVVVAVFEYFLFFAIP